jgi:hypothetical protein
VVCDLLNISEESDPLIDFQVCCGGVGADASFSSHKTGEQNSKIC